MAYITINLTCVVDDILTHSANTLAALGILRVLSVPEAPHRLKLRTSRVVVVRVNLSIDNFGQETTM